jgi:uncharacterized protein (TIGR02217 family)
MALPSFIEQRFPSLGGWDYTVDPVYEVGVVSTGREAHEKRNLPTPYPRRRIAVRVPSDKWADIPLVNRWHHAVRGRAVGFRVKDPSDFLSIDIGANQTIDQPTAAMCGPADQPLEEIEETPGGFRLVKDYTVWIDATVNLTQRLPIIKPVVDTIRVANHLGAEQPASSWTIDYTRGVLQPLEAFVGTPATWGGQYDLPMRFNSSTPIDVREHRLSEVIFELIELPRGDFL